MVEMLCIQNIASLHQIILPFGIKRLTYMPYIHGQKIKWDFMLSLPGTQ